MSTDYIHPISDLRLLRAQSDPHPDDKYWAMHDDAYWALVHENQRFHNEMSIKEQKKLAAEQEDMERQEREYAAERRRQDTIARLAGPIRIRPEPKNRDLADEEKANADLIAHHTRRTAEEIAWIQQKFACEREHAKATFVEKMESAHVTYAQKIAAALAHDDADAVRRANQSYTDQLKGAAEKLHHKMTRFSTDCMESRIEAVRCRRAQLAWTCPNDGQAHPFTWQGHQYHRTYNGEMWCTPCWFWVGRWNNYYIASSKAPIDDKVSAELCLSLSPWY